MSPSRLYALSVLALAVCVTAPLARAGDLRITLPRRSKLTPVQRLNREGVEAVQKRHYDKAEALFYKAYLFDPSDPFTLNNLGYISELQGQLDRAQNFYKLAAENSARLVTAIVARLGKLMQNRLSANVIYTRKDDSYVTLEKRAELANVAQANLFVSIHANYSDYPSARGVETYFTNTYSSIKARAEEDRSEPSLQNVNWTDIDIRKKVRESRRLASSIQHSLYETLAAKNPGLPNRGVKEAQYVVLTGTSMPAVLAEISFVSSPTDENNLQSSSYRQRIAEALFQGIAHYEAESNRLAMASAPTKQVR